MIKVSQKTKFDLKNEKKDRYILVCHIFFSTHRGAPTYQVLSVVNRYMGPVLGGTKSKHINSGVPPTGRVQPIPRVLTESDTY